MPNLFYLHKLLIAHRATAALFTVSLDMHLENRAFLLTGAPIPRRNLAS